MTDPPVVVFVTAYDEHAAAAYGLGAVDYLLKPVSAERLAAALARVRRFTAPAGSTAAEQPAPTPVDALAAVPVELAGRTHYVRRDDVRFVEAHGDYVRLHTPTGAHLVRIPISRLEEHWQRAGFTRVHRSYLLAVPAVRELRSDLSGGLLAHTDVGDVPVSRRHARELRELLLEAATRGGVRPGRRRRGGGGEPPPRPRRVAVTSPQTRLALAGRRTAHPAAPPPLSPAAVERARRIHRRQLRLALGVLGLLAALLVGLPLVLAAAPDAGRSCGWPGCRCPGWRWPCCRTRCWRCWPAGSCAGPSGRSASG